MMKEAELRTQVLLPLFVAMGYHDVFHYHGGAHEQGKDIVMWEVDKLGRRVNYAVVVKASRITGQAQGKSSAAEVAFQLQQCFGSPFQDPRTLQECQVHRCIVISNQEILKEALVSIRSAIQPTGLQGYVDFIDGTRLLELVEQYLPYKTAMQSLAHVQSLMESASPNWRVTSHSRGGKVILGIEAKHPEATVSEPISIRGRFRFPNTPEGLMAAEAVKEHLNKGTPVEIDHTYIEELQFPEFLRPFMDSTQFSVQLGPRQLSAPVLATLHVVPTIGEPVELTAIELRGIYAGVESVVLTNEHQSVPWHFFIEVDRLKRMMQFRFTANLIDVNVKRELEAQLFVRALAGGGFLKIIHEETDLVLLGGPIPAGHFERPDEEWINLLRKVAEIQRLACVPLVIPPREISAEEVDLIDCLICKLSTGRFDSNGIESVTLNMTRTGAENAVTIFADGRTETITLESPEETAELFETSFSLGPVTVAIGPVGISPADLETVRSRVNQETGDELDEIPVRFTAPQGSADVRFDYERWRVMSILNDES